jgi:WD40 repeat protein
LAETQWLFSPDETALAIRTADDRRIRLWDLQRGKLIVQFAGDRGPDTTLRFSSDSRLFAYTQVNSVYMYDLKRRQQLSDFTGLHEHSNVAFDSAGRTLLTVESDDSVRLRDLRSGRTLRRGVTAERGLWFSGDNAIPPEKLLTAEVFVDKEKRIRLHDPITGIGCLQLNDPLRIF